MHSLWFFLLTVPKTNSIYTLSLHDALPIFIENSQDIKALADKVGETLGQFRGAHGLLLQRHGLYSWGNDMAETKRHVEILEFLLETTGRTLLLRKQGSGMEV